MTCSPDISSSYHPRLARSIASSHGYRHLRHYQREFHSRGRELKHVHVWSDGCGSQNKNRWQVHWTTQGRVTFAYDDPGGGSYKGVRIAHHFFQSCHGKGPFDSEGAVVKTAPRDAEVRGRYMLDSRALFAFLEVLLAPAAIAAFALPTTTHRSYCPVFLLLLFIPFAPPPLAFSSPER